jgi:hypothetical protein
MYLTKQRPDLPSFGKLSFEDAINIANSPNRDSILSFLHRNDDDDHRGDAPIIYEPDGRRQPEDEEDDGFEGGSWYDPECLYSRRSRAVPPWMFVVAIAVAILSAIMY